MLLSPLHGDGFQTQGERCSADVLPWTGGGEAMENKELPGAGTKPDDPCPGTSGWLRWLAWLDDTLPALRAVRREAGSKDAEPCPRRCVEGTVVSLQGRFSKGTGRFRLERIGVLEEGATTLATVPVHEAARIPSTLGLGIRVSVTVRDGLVVFVKTTTDMVAPRRVGPERRDAAVRKTRGLSAPSARRASR